MTLRSCVLMLWCCLLPATAGAAKTSAPTASAPVMLVLGDSISAGYGLDAGQGWVHLLEQKLKAQGSSWQVVNASVSGDTTSGGLARLPGLLQRHQPKLVLVELGGNDGLRALPVTAMRANLDQIVALSRKAGAEPVIFEMRVPDNYGPTYTQAFARTFATVSEERKVPMVPFLLMHFVSDPKSFQEDGIHPAASVQPQILEAAWPTLSPLLVH